MPRPPRWVRATRSRLEESPLRFTVKRWYPRVEDTPLRKCPCEPKYWRAAHQGLSTYRAICLRCGLRFKHALYIRAGTVDTMNWLNLPNSDVWLDQAGYFHARHRDYRTPPDAATAFQALAQEKPLRPWKSREEKPVRKRKPQKGKPRKPRKTRKRKPRKPVSSSSSSDSQLEVLKSYTLDNKPAKALSESVRQRRRSLRAVDITKDLHSSQESC